MKRAIRILIIEDNKFWGIMLGNVLKKLSINSDWAKNGKLGIDKIQQGGDYDGIITDVQMPEMDGLEFTQKIRGLGFTKPIIGFSSMGEDEDINSGLDAGMDAYVKKSISIESLKNLLGKLRILEIS